ncbi:MAG: hypothetical protein ABIS14_09045, partial [Sphingomonas sp.]
MAGARQLQATGAWLMGWVMLASVGFGAALMLRLTGVGKATWTFAGAALMLGAVGYALQGSPDLPGHPVKANATPGEVDPGLVALRGQMFGQFTADGAFVIGSDAYARSGDLKGAADYIFAGIRQNPTSALLWTSLGTVLAEHDGNTLSPAATFAFRRAV